MGVATVPELRHHAIRQASHQAARLHCPMQQSTPDGRCQVPVSYPEHSTTIVNEANQTAGIPGDTMPDPATGTTALQAETWVTDKGAGRIPGNRGIWVGITCVFVEFAVLFTVYFVARAHFPEAFRTGAEQLPRLAGTLITLFLISSGFCIAAAVVTLRNGQRRASLLWLIGGMLLAFGYPITKYFEIRWNLAHGVDAQAGVFVGAYYYLTLNHLVHASWGILGMFWVLARHLTGAYSAEQHDGLEALACYWHATDIIWLVIFPFFYVLA